MNNLIKIMTITASLAMLGGCSANASASPHSLGYNLSRLQSSVTSSDEVNRSQIVMNEYHTKSLLNSDKINQQQQTENLNQTQSEKTQTETQMENNAANANNNSAYKHNFKRSEGYYSPRYTNNYNSITDSDIFTHQISQLETLFNVSQDLLTANEKYIAVKNNLTNSLENTTALVKQITESEITLSKEQLLALKEYANAIKKSTQSLNSTRGIIRRNSKNVATLKSELVQNVDILVAKYVNILNCIDDRITAMENALGTLNMINGIIQTNYSENNMTTESTENTQNLGLHKKQGNTANSNTNTLNKGLNDNKIVKISEETYSFKNPLLEQMGQQNLDNGPIFNNEQILNGEHNLLNSQNNQTELKQTNDMQNNLNMYDNAYNMDNNPGSYIVDSEKLKSLNNEQNLNLNAEKNEDQTKLNLENNMDNNNINTKNFDKTQSNQENITQNDNLNNDKIADDKNEDKQNIDSYKTTNDNVNIDTYGPNYSNIDTFYPNLYGTGMGGMGYGGGMGGGNPYGAGLFDNYNNSNAPKATPYFPNLQNARDTDNNLNEKDETTDNNISDSKNNTKAKLQKNIDTYKNNNLKITPPPSKDTEIKFLPSYKTENSAFNPQKVSY